MLDPLAERLPRLFFDDSPSAMPIAVTTMPTLARKLRVPQPTLEAVIVAVLQINGVAGSSAAAMAGDLVEVIKEYYARSGAQAQVTRPPSGSPAPTQIPGMPVSK
jgi:hypothetical protein